MWRQYLVFFSVFVASFRPCLRLCAPTRTDRAGLVHVHARARALAEGGIRGPALAAAAEAGGECTRVRVVIVER